MPGPVPFTSAVECDPREIDGRELSRARPRLHDPLQVGGQIRLAADDA